MLSEGNAQNETTYSSYGFKDKIFLRSLGTYKILLRFAYMCGMHTYVHEHTRACPHTHTHTTHQYHRVKDIMNML